MVRVGGHVVADSTRALTLQEASYPPVQYVPRADVDEDVLERTATTTYCPYKGTATYDSVVLPTQTVEDVVWGYEHPHAAVGEIRDHVAFYPDRADVEVLPG